MNLSVGIVGLPNVGKSTLFNALLKKQQALAANYPFATIEPNIGIVPVPDERLVRLAEITKEEEGMSSLPPIKPATVEFVDIAGLVKGASEGAGLGNKFLSHVREVKIIAHVVRAFEDGNIVKEGSVDPKTDYEVIRTELALADLQSLENQELRIKNQGEKKVIQAIIEKLNKGEPFDGSNLQKEELDFVKQLNLLSSKPEIVVLNVSEKELFLADQIVNKYSGDLGLLKEKFVVISARIEEELAQLSEVEQKEYLRELGLEESGLERLIQKAYSELGLISFLTAGEKEVRAWTVREGVNAQEAAGEIHTDFIKNFIKAEVVSYDDFLGSNGWKGARANGRARLEGKEYVVADGDVVEFKIGR
jgi:GTP-binding protein YchF